MKPKLLVHQSQARTIDSPAEVERLLNQGWVIASPKPRTKSASNMRRLNADRRAAGWTTRTLWFSPEQLAVLKAALSPGETYAELVMRLVEENSLLRANTQEDGHKVEMTKTPCDD